MTYLYVVLGDHFWWVGWIITSTVSILIAMFFTTLLLPLFNKVTPLDAGDLRISIEKFASKVQFPLMNIFIMDGSKRSTKANAFFSGLGSKKNIVLFDNLIKDLNTEEVTAVLAHEVGHYQMKHVLKGVILSCYNGITFLFLDGWQVSKNWLLGAQQPSLLSLVSTHILFSLCASFIADSINHY